MAALLRRSFFCRLTTRYRAPSSPVRQSACRFPVRAGAGGPGSKVSKFGRIVRFANDRAFPGSRIRAHPRFARTASQPCISLSLAPSRRWPPRPSLRLNIVLTCGLGPLSYLARPQLVRLCRTLPPGILFFTFASESEKQGRGKKESYFK